MNLLVQVPEIDLSSIKRGKNFQTMVEGVSAGFRNTDTNIQIMFMEEKAVAIFFSIDEYLPLANAIKKFGEPKYIISDAMAGDPFVYHTVDFVYPDQGVCLHHQNLGVLTRIPKTYRITGSINIIRMFYVDPSLPKGQFEYGCFTGGDENELRTRRQDWKGYGKYDVYEWNWK